MAILAKMRAKDETSGYATDFVKITMRTIARAVKVPPPLLHSS